MTYQVMNGNELVIQGGLEAGFSLYTGYPGSPLADYFNILHARRRELARRGVRVAIANSEANAAAMASGCKQAGRNCLLAMKSMGLHVAADSLSVGNFANPGRPKLDPETDAQTRPGVVVVVGDDPWSMSTSTPADSRYLFKHLHMPFLEPASPQEVKDWVAHALTVSQRSSVYCGLLLTTFLAEGGGRVQAGDPAPVPAAPEPLASGDFELSETVMVPPNSLTADARMIRERFPRVREVLDALDLDRIQGNKEARIGFVASGGAYATLHQAMNDGGLLGRYSLFKPACSYPLAGRRLLPWLRELDTVIVVEEKRGFLEAELIAFCQEHGLSVQVMGKRFQQGALTREGFPAHGGLSYETIRDKLEELQQLLGEPGCGGSPDRAVGTRLDVPLPRRLPTFCPGCPHRETLSLLKELRRTLEQEGVDLISHGDVGCYSLSFLPPFREMHNIGAMGQGGAVGAGLDSFSRNPSVVLVGDSTFFHSGMNTISSSVQMGHDITYIVLDNDVTAMTGHQMTPTTGCSVEGRERPRQDIMAVVRGLGVSDAIEVNPSDRYFYRNVLADYIRRPGTKVIVSSKECGLTYHGRQRARDRALFRRGGTKPMQAFFRVSTAACEDCRACVEATGCPGLTRAEDPYGTKIAIDPQICVADGYCSRIMACPSFEQVQVYDFHPSRHQERSPAAGAADLPDPLPRKTLDDVLAGNDWRVVVTGVGGSGVTTISRVLAEAARDMDGRDELTFLFMDQKGLAQRNGQVTGHLALHRRNRPAGPITPKGTADLLISPDLLDGSQSLEFLAPHGLALLDEEFQIPLSMLLDRNDDQAPLTASSLGRTLERTLGERLHRVPGKSLTGRRLGRSVYGSALLLGTAYQLGALPFGPEHLEQAFRRAVPEAEFEANWQAFILGRRLITDGREALMNGASEPAAEDTPLLLERSLMDSLLPGQRRKVMIRRFRQTTDALAAHFPDIPRGHHARYVHDLLVYDRGARLQGFLLDAHRLARLYTVTEHRQLALRTLVRTYVIKDEPFVAHLLVSPMEQAARQQAFGRLGRRFRVSRVNRPSLPLLGRQIAFDLRTRDWMLRLVRHLRFLRRLPGWHRKELRLAGDIRHALLTIVPGLPADRVRHWLARLDNIKGYREVRLEQGRETLEALAGTDRRAPHHGRPEPRTALSGRLARG